MPRLVSTDYRGMKPLLQLSCDSSTAFSVISFRLVSPTEFILMNACPYSATRFPFC